MEGRTFFVLTDHKPLTHVFDKIVDAWSDHQCRHISEISEYMTDMRHVVGAENVVADALSRVSAINNTVNLQHMAEAQKKCVESRQLHNVSSLRLTRVPFEEGRVTLLCDTSTGKNRPVVPNDCQ